MSLEIVRAQPERADTFAKGREREALKAFYGFSVIWHEQSHDVLAIDGEQIVGAARVRIAASLAHVERAIVVPERRRGGVGGLLVAELADIANYYNCHKMTVMVPHCGDAQAFFETCGYKEEAVLPQHTFKLDMAVLRKFLL